ncbi:kinase-like domain, phloem protein 2-like protein [Tanacetum coccineum]
MLQGKNFEHLKIPLNDINQATNDFDEAHCIGSGGFGKVYKADLEHFDSSISSSIEYVSKCDLPRKRSTVAIKRINNQEGEQGFIAEIETLSSCKHDNIISLLGYCYEGNGAMILVYEHASKGSLENYLGSSDNMTNLTWENNGRQDRGFWAFKFPPSRSIGSTFYIVRIEVLSILDPELSEVWTHKESLDIFLETAFRCVAETQTERPTIEVVIRELKKALNCQENHKDNLKLSLEDVKGVVTHAHGHSIIAAKRLVQENLLQKSEFMDRAEILWSIKHEKCHWSCWYCDEEDEKIIVYEYASRGSLDKYLSDDSLTWVMRLKICIDIAIGLEFLHGTVSSPEMEDNEIWEPKLPNDYKEIIEMSKCPEDYSTIKKEDLYSIFSKGILLQEDKVLLSFDGIGKRNEMVSATMFSYENSCPHEWKSLPESRLFSLPL